MSCQDKERPRPKGAMSAYAYFVQVIREEHKRKHPGENVVFTEFSKKCAEKWKLMTPKEKKRFEEMAANDKDRYNKEVNSFQSKEGGRRRRKRRRIKEPGQPKRAWSAFFFFCNEYRPKIRELHPDWRVGNIAKELGRLWENCTDKEKYEKQSEADKQRYEEQMSQYRAGKYVPPVKRPKADGSKDEMPIGNTSTDDPNVINSIDPNINEEESEEEEEEYEDEIEEPEPEEFLKSDRTSPKNNMTKIANNELAGNDVNVAAMTTTLTDIEHTNSNSNNENNNNGHLEDQSPDAAE